MNIAVIQIKTHIHSDKILIIPLVSPIVIIKINNYNTQV